ncbi:uncharacterized protein LOC133530689 [Cydia pomonella]|uniref:uncharacterized protein LOC133530689 n=1 Tax=Cydia pomonella TaxID=82600 RepID=UPI002ADE6844|nr:uncharacterized protein LOC133530689 [Cydia pomonella]
MAAEMTLELFEKHLSDLKKEDIQKKMDIARNVSEQCELYRQIGKDSTPPLIKCHNLTGVPIETLKAVNSLEKKSIKFEDWLKEQKLMPQSYNFEYNSIRQLLLTNYTQLLEIPTGIKDSKDYDFSYKKFFTLVQLPGTKASIIVEKPETFMERQRFLYTKMMYREQKKNIVYIGKINLLLNHGKFSYKEDNVQSKTRFIIAASQKFGYLGYIYCCGTGEEYMTNWIEEKILPQLSEESVIIFQENVLNNDEDKVVSDLSKEHIINWLNANEIPHDPKMHRAELYKLVKTIQKSRVEKVSPAELSFRAKGHITIRKKRCNLNNNFFDPFWGLLIHEMNHATTMPVIKTTMKQHQQDITKTLNIIVQNCPLEYWNTFGNTLLDKERNIYREDLEMEHVIDKLMTMVKHEGLPKEWETNSKLYEYSRAAEQKYILLSDNLLQLFANMQTSKHYKTLNIFK